MLEARDLLLVVMRWLHSLAAVVWLGALMTTWLRVELDREVNQSTDLEPFGRATRDISQICVAAFLVSGAILMFDRLSASGVGSLYAAFLGLKIALGLAMFLLAPRLARIAADRQRATLRRLVILGITILFLAALLKSLHEQTMTFGTI